MGFNYSLIIPYYNSPEKLERLIQSIPVRADLQIIAVDDCSTSGLELFSKLKYEYKYVEWHRTEHNGGAGLARNVGLTFAKGKYLIFADSDDFFTPYLNEILNRHHNTEFDIVYFYTNEIDSTTGLICCGLDYRNKAIGLYRKSHKKEDLCNISTAPWGKLIRRGLVENHGIRFQETRISNDVFFSLMVDFYSNNIFAEEIAAYNYSTNQISVSSSVSIEKRIERLKIDLERNRFLNEHRLQKKYLSSQLKDSLAFFFRQTKNQEIGNKIMMLCMEYGITQKLYYYLFYKYQIRQIFKNILRNRWLHGLISSCNTLTGRILQNNDTDIER